MANESQNDEQTVEEPKKKGFGLIVWLLVCVVAGGAGFAVPFFMKPSEEAAEGPSQTLVNEDESTIFVEFDEVVVNLNEPRLNRYLRLKLWLMVGESMKAQTEEALEKNKTNLVSWLLSFLADKKMDDIRGATGQNRLRNEIRNHFNAVLFPEGHQHIRGVFFQEFNIQ